MIVEIKTSSEAPMFPIFFEGPSNCFEYLLTNSNPLQIVVKDKDSDLKRDLKKQLVLAEIPILVDFISWLLDIPIEDYKIKAKKTSSSDDLVNAKKISFERILDDHKLALLSAYREIQNEVSPVLRFLMYHRLLESISRKFGHKGDIDKLIKYYNVQTPLVKNKRNPRNLLSRIKYVRNKIHPTDNSYKFPYEALEKQERNIKKIARTVISDLLI